MLPRTLLLATLSCLISPAAHALTTAECGAIEEQVTVVLQADYGIEVTQSPASQSQATAIGCTITDLDIYVGALGVMYRADQVTFTGTGLMDWVRGDLVLPETVDGRIEGLSVNPNVPLPSDFSWLAGLRAEEIFLSATWNERRQRLQISPLRIDLGNQNLVTLHLGGRAAGWTPYNTPTVDFGMTELRLDVDFNGLFEQAILPPIVQNGNDISPSSMAFLAAVTEGMMQNAPPRLFSSAAPAEMGAFLRALPTPRGFFALTATTTTPLSVERVLAELRTGIPVAAAVPEDLNIDIIWEPSN